MANDITIGSGGAMTVSARGSLPSFPSSGESSRPEMAQSALAIFADMSKSLQQLKLNSDIMLKQMSTVTEGIEAVLSSKKDGLKDKESKAEDKANEDRSEKIGKTAADKAGSFFEKMWNVIAPMLLGFFMGITDMTKPLGLLKVALYSLVAFLGVKILGGLLIRALVGTFTRLGVKLVDAMIAVIRSRGAAGGAGTGGVITDTGTGTGKDKKTKPKMKGKAGLIGGLAVGLGLGFLATDEDDSTTEAVGKTAAGGALGSAAGYGIDRGIDNIKAKTAEKATEKVTEKVVEEAAEGAAVKSTSKILGKGALKSAAKKIPALGAVAGLAFGAQRAMAGDWVGASGEVASGALGALSFTGVALGGSLAVDAGLVARDISMQNDVDKIQEVLSAAPSSDKKAKKTLTELEKAQADAASAFEQLQIIKDNGYDVEKMIPKAAATPADKIKPAEKTVASTNQLDQTRQQHQMARNTPPTPPPAPTSTNVIQTNNVNNGTTIKKPPRAEPDSLSYGK